MPDLKKFIRDLNETWRNAQYENLYEFFHKKVVMLPPGSSQPIEGIEPMVESYRQFGSSGMIHRFDIMDIVLYRYESVTICHMRFEVDYEIESGRYREKGLEVYAIDTSGSNPLIVWRSQIALETDET